MNENFMKHGALSWNELMTTDVAKAKAFSAETVGHVMDVSSQIFGGMGYMEEQDTTLYLRRGKQYQLALGGTEYWEDVIAEEIIDREPVVLT